MQVTLNFGKGEIPKLMKLLSQFQKGKTTNYFEEQRVRHLDCTITLYSSGKISIQGFRAEEVKEEILKEMKLKKELIIGIDETGRGERDGPMVIAGVIADTTEMLEMRDSKKTSNIEKKQEMVSEKMLGSVKVTLNSELIDLMRSNGKNLNQIEANIIDKIYEILSETADAKTIADGAPLRTKNKEIIFKPKTDDLEPVVGAASILAKHERNHSKDKNERKTWKTKSL